MYMPQQQQPYVTMYIYKNAIEPDQLYDLSIDPLEQNNLIFCVNLDRLKTKMKRELSCYLDTFKSHPYNLEDTRVFSLKTFDPLKRKLLSRGLDPVPWWNEEKVSITKARMKDMFPKELYK